MSESVYVRLVKDDSRPSDAEVENLFDRVLKALLIPEKAQASLKANETMDGKWRLVQLNKQLLETNAVSTNFAAEDKALLDDLKRNAARPSLGDVIELKKRLASGSRGHLEGFYEHHGLQLLSCLLWARLEKPAYYTELDSVLCVEVFGCVKTLMNHRKGLEKATSHADLLEAIVAASLHDPSSTTGAPPAAIGLELLAVASHYGAADKVLAALSPVGGDQDEERGGAATSPAKDPFLGLRRKMLTKKKVPKAIFAATLTLANEIVIAERDTVERCALRSCAEPLFAAIAPLSSEDCIDDTESVRQKRESARKACDVEGELVATKQSGVAKSALGKIVGTQRTKRRGFVLRGSKLSWASANDGGENNGVAPHQDGSPFKHKMPRRKSSLASLRSDSDTSVAAGDLQDSSSRYLDLNNIVEIAPYTLDAEIRAETPFGFELAANGGKTWAFGAASHSDRRKWLLAIQRAVDRVELCRQLKDEEEDDATINSDSPLRPREDDVVWGKCLAKLKQIMAPIEARARNVLKAQTAAFEAIAEQDRIEALAEDGVDLGDLEAVFARVAKRAAMNPDAKRRCLDLGVKALKSLAARDTAHFPDDAQVTDSFKNLALPSSTSSKASAPPTTVTAPAPATSSSRLPPPPAKFKPPPEPEKTKKVSPPPAAGSKGQLPSRRKRAPPPPPAKMPPPSAAESKTTTTSAASDASSASAAEAPLATVAPPEAVVAYTKAAGAVERDPRLAKYERMLKMKVPRGAIEVKMAAEGLDPTVLLGGGSERTSRRVAAMSISMGRRPGGLLGFKQAKTYGEQPRIEMRAWHWHPLRGEEAEKAEIWNDVIDLSHLVDKDHIDSAFAKKATVKPVAATAPSAAAKQQRKSFVDPRKQQNCGIVLAKLKRPPRAITAAVYRGDVSDLDATQVEMLAHAKPSVEDSAAASERDDLDDVDDLQALRSNNNVLAVEVFFRATSLVPGYNDRLDALALRHSLDTQLESLEQAIVDVDKACESALHSPDLKLALSACLSVGNYVNGGTTRGGAEGFALSTLPRVATTKGHDGSTFADHVAGVLRRHDPGSFERLAALRVDSFDSAVNSSLPHGWDDSYSNVRGHLTRLESLIVDDTKVVDAARIALEDYTNTKKLIEQASTPTSGAVEAADDGDDEDEDEVDDEFVMEGDDDEEEEDNDEPGQPEERIAFLASMKPFATIARLRLDDLKRRRSKIDDKIGATVAAFGEKPTANKMTPSELFGDYLVPFVKSLTKSNISFENAKKDAKRKGLRTLSTRQLPAVKKEDTADDLFGAFSEMQLNGAAVVDEFRRQQDQ